MKQQLIILGTITAAASTIGLGYLGTQYFGKTTMYAISGAIVGLSATAQIMQSKSKSLTQSSEQSLAASFSAIPVSKVQQPIYQTIEPNIGQSIESHSNEKLISEIDPIIERFVKLGLDEF